MLLQLALWLTLPSGTGPSASAPESTAAHSRWSRTTPAERAFRRVERKRGAYLRLQLRLDGQSLQQKARAAEALEAEYAAVIERGEPRYGVAASVRIAEVYLHFADEIRRAPLPDGQVDRSELEAIALGPEERARKALEAGFEEARRGKVRGRWRTRLEDLRTRLRSDPRRLASR